MGVVEVRGMTYHLDDSLKKKWDKVKDGHLAKHDEDRFYIVDGQEGSGKSLFTLQQASYIDPTILDDENGKVLPRICFTPREFLDAVRNTKSTKEQTKCVIFDEAFRGMSSKSAISQINKQVVEAIMEMRQNNLVVFLVSPSFYLLELYPAMMRSKALFHVVKEKGSKRRYVRIFGFKSKAKLYQMGIRKGWGYPRLTKHRVRFYNKYPAGDELEARYRKKKRDTHVQNSYEEDNTHKWKKQRNLCIVMLYKLLGSYQKVSDMMKSYDMKMSKPSIGQIMLDMKEKHGKFFDEDGKLR